MLPADYDKNAMTDQAELLASEADRAAIVTMIIVGFIGVLLGGVAFYLLSERNEALAIVLALGIPIAGAVIGGTVGESRALKLRSQAQQLLILLAIERNTHKEVSH